MHDIITISLASLSLDELEKVKDLLIYIGAGPINLNKVQALIEEKE